MVHLNLEQAEEWKYFNQKLHLSNWKILEAWSFSILLCHCLLKSTTQAISILKWTISNYFLEIETHSHVKFSYFQNAHLAESPKDLNSISSKVQFGHSIIIRMDRISFACSILDLPGLIKKMKRNWTLFKYDYISIGNHRQSSFLIERIIVATVK